MKQARIISIANQKGGVGKTTTAFNMAYALSNEGNKVLLLDFDPQGSLTLCVGIDNPDSLKTTILHLMNSSMEDEKLPDRREYIITRGNLDIIPCNIELSVVEVNLRDEMGGEKTLSNILETYRNDYDYIIIDTSPSLGLLTINALAASDSVLITVNPQFLSAIGLKLLIKTIIKVKKRINPRLEVEGILMTMCDNRTKLYKDVYAMVDEAYKDNVRIFKTEIPTSVKVGEANLYGQSIIEYQPKSKVAMAYQNFAKELIGNE